MYEIENMIFQYNNEQVSTFNCFILLSGLISRYSSSH